MTQTDRHIPPVWGTATAPPPSAIPKTGRIILIALGCLAAAVAAIVLVGPSDKAKESGGSYYASAGWTAQRAADLRVSLRRDAGFSTTEADCVMRYLVGHLTWMEWRALGAGSGQLQVIRAAERSC